MSEHARALPTPSAPPAHPPAAVDWVAVAPSVARFVRSKLRDAHAAQDVTQDVLLKLTRSARPDLTDQQLLPFALRAARNAIIDHLRRRARLGALRRDAGLTPHPQAESAASELASWLPALIAHLPEPYRTALTAADLHGESQQAMAQRFGISLPAAKSRVQRARRLLRAIIDDCCDVETAADGSLVDYHTTERTARYCHGCAG